MPSGDFTAVSNDANKTREKVNGQKSALRSNNLSDTGTLNTDSNNRILRNYPTLFRILNTV